MTETIRTITSQAFPLIQQKLADAATVPVVVTAAIPTPQWGNLALVGSNLVGRFTPVFGSNHYEIAYNTSPQNAGATLYLATTASSFSTPYNMGSASQLLSNGTFESGKVGWNFDISNGVCTIDPSNHHSGAYSARVNFPVAAEADSYVIHDRFAINASEDYAFSGWLEVIANDAEIYGLVVWYDSSGSYLGYDELFHAVGEGGGWTNYTATVTSPASAVYAEVMLSLSGTGFTVELYMDDWAFVGKPTMLSPSLYFACRAIDSTGNPTPYSSWLQPLIQAEQLGDGSIFFDHDASAIHSSNFVEGVSGFRVDDNGIHGAVVVASSAPSTTYAGQMWLDISGAVVLKIRNLANDAWYGV